MLFIGCNTSLDECNCNKIGIYGYPSNILTPIGRTPESLLKSEPCVLEDFTKINRIFGEFENFRRIDYDGEIDNRFLLKLYCNGHKNIIVQANSNVARINGENFKTPETFESLITKILIEGK